MENYHRGRQTMDEELRRTKERLGGMERARVLFFDAHEA
jgi:hypothetical protein